jgi:RNA polymerase primary sigma factor
MPSPARATSSGHRTALRETESLPGGSLNAYLRDISVYPLITIDEEAALSRRVRAGDHDAVDALVCAHLRFVVTVAKKYQHQGAPLEDLINEGNIGLMRAARRFDETRGIRFISYAVWWIRQAVVECVAAQSHIVRVPRNRVGEMYRIGKERGVLTQELGRAPTLREVAHEMGLSERDVRDSACLVRTELSLDSAVDDDTDTRLLDIIADETSDAPDESMVVDSRTATISRALLSLPPREARVLSMYFGLETGEGTTLDAIGAALGVTRERVRHIRDKALARLRKGGEAPVLRALAS